MIIVLAELEKIAEVAIASLKNKAPKIRLYNDYYWTTFSGDRLNQTKNPEIGIGSLSDDLQEVTKIISKQDSPDILTFDRVGNLFIAIRDALTNAPQNGYSFELDLSEYSEICRLMMEAARQNGITEVEMRDFYYKVSDADRFAFPGNNIKAIPGSLFDDWRMLQRLLSQPASVLPQDYERLGNVIIGIGEEINHTYGLIPLEHSRPD